ncbi:hypothetical protein E2C01_088828 [Portunus trituberculatus]|uniref:Uncharacterized protein n=1 Tax=Portunus trituberculatus TaxID=210409 RepID=A0A5B7JKX6_PORTR|nr:hypothetical protein [Portunus trituberculatus]
MTAWVTLAVIVVGGGSGGSSFSGGEVGEGGEGRGGVMQAIPNLLASTLGGKLQTLPPQPPPQPPPSPSPHPLPHPPDPFSFSPSSPVVSSLLYALHSALPSPLLDISPSTFPYPHLPHHHHHYTHYHGFY